MQAEVKSVESKMIKALAYDQENHRLLVQFKNGSWYEYIDVPEGTYQAVLRADSVGGAFSTLVKQAAYSYLRVNIKKDPDECMIIGSFPFAITNSAG